MAILKEWKVRNLLRCTSVEGPNRRGRPLGRWEDEVKEYVSERGAMGKWVGVYKEGVYG